MTPWAGPILLALVCFLLAGIPSAGADTDAMDEPFAQAVEAVRNKEYSTAHTIFGALAERGAPDAQFNIGLLLKAGLGRPQNFEEAYFWFVLSSLGNERRADPMVTEISDLLPQAVQGEVFARIITRLDAQLAEGNQRAIMKYAKLHADFLFEPDIETAYVWYSIGQALGLRGASAGTVAMSELLEPEALIAAQRRAQQDFDASQFAS